jgi:hypothetical protein
MPRQKLHSSQPHELNGDDAGERSDGGADDPGEMGEPPVHE